MKAVLLYYPFEIAENANSGSKLRPKEIYHAFKQWGADEGVEILLLSGDSLTRDKLFSQWKSAGKLNDLLFCYMENQTIPLWLTDKGHFPKKLLVDRSVMSFLKKHNVPVGVFYRDVYWKFDELYPLKGIKKNIMKTIYKIEEKFYEKYCDVIFLPSEAMGKYVDINKRMVALPPGGKLKEIKKKNRSHGIAQGIYVGGINNEDYGLFLLIEAFEIANKDKKICELTVVCRADEYDKLPQEKKQYLQERNVTVKHLSGEDLNALYLEMDFAFIPRLRSTYNDFAIPVKLVEYLSNELPVVASDCTAQKEFIEPDQYGIICSDNAKHMAEGIRRMSAEFNKYRENIRRSFVDNHSWVARVKQIKQTLKEEEL